MLRVEPPVHVGQKRFENFCDNGLPEEPSVEGMVALWLVHSTPEQAIWV